MQILICIFVRIFIITNMKSLIEHQILSDIEKSKSGVYEDNPKNRKLGRVGQKYGGAQSKEKDSMKDINRFISIIKLNPNGKDAYRYLESEELTDRELNNFIEFINENSFSHKLSSGTKQNMFKWRALAETERRQRRKR